MSITRSRRLRAKVPLGSSCCALPTPRDMVQLTGEGLIYEVTASGGYEDCIGMLADELADLVDEPFVRLVIRMKRERRRQRISRRAYMPRG